jgi:hypothetical protein
MIQKCWNAVYSAIILHVVSRGGKNNNEISLQPVAVSKDYDTFTV